MAINISDKYPGRSNPPSVDYPQGSIKNQTAPGARDGTPLDEAWANDKEGFFQKALSYRGVTANGTTDTAVSSQYFDAVFADPTESLRGMPLVATQAETNEGTDDSSIVTPKKLRAGFAVSLAVDGYIAFPTWLGGVVIQWGNATTKTTKPFPIAFPSALRAIVGCHTGGEYAGISFLTTGTTRTGLHGLRNSTTGNEIIFLWIAIGN